MLRKILCIAVGIASLAGAHLAFAAVEINTADQAQLDSIAGIGPSTSRAILEERKKNGNFKDWNELEQRVRGIGERNSVKLSAAGFLVNGQQRAAQVSATPSARAIKTSREVKDTGKDGKAPPQSAYQEKRSETKR